MCADDGCWAGLDGWGKEDEDARGAWEEKQGEGGEEGEGGEKQGEAPPLEQQLQAYLTSLSQVGGGRGRGEGGPLATWLVLCHGV